MIKSTKVYLRGWRNGIVKYGRKWAYIIYFSPQIRVKRVKLTELKTRSTDNNYSTKQHAKRLLKQGRLFGITRGATNVLRKVL